MPPTHVLHIPPGGTPRPARPLLTITLLPAVTRDSRTAPHPQWLSRDLSTGSGCPSVSPFRGTAQGPRLGLSTLRPREPLSLPSRPLGQQLKSGRRQAPEQDLGTRLGVPAPRRAISSRRPRRRAPRPPALSTRGIGRDSSLRFPPKRLGGTGGRKCHSGSEWRPGEMRALGEATWPRAEATA